MTNQQIKRRHTGRNILLLFLLVVFLYPCTYFTPYKKVRVIDVATGKPVPNAMVQYKVQYWPISDVIFTSISVTRQICAQTNKNGVARFLPFPVFQMPFKDKIYNITIYHNAYYEPERTFWDEEYDENWIPMLRRDKSYDPCFQINEHYASTWPDPSSDVFNSCSDYRQALEQEEKLLPQHPCSLYGEDLLKAAKNRDLNRLQEILNRHPEMIDFHHGRYEPLDFSPLVFAIENGDTVMFSFLIGRNADINFKDLRQASALQHAVGRGQSEMVLVLLDKGADVNTADIEANTPLLVALHNQEWELARELIQRGADPKAKNEMRDSAVTLAGQSGNMDLFLQFWDKGADNDALLRDLAFRGAPDEILQLLFDQGAGSNNANVDQALWEAAAGCHLDTIRFFLAHGANPNATNDDMGITACETRYNSCKGPNEREEIQKYLVERGCIIDGKP